LGSPVSWSDRFTQIATRLVTPDGA
jgi:hypothetical protein